ncbi:sensor histidine kinase [Filimonas lacunae]|nr:sensor histidine kinase [Filimonas lacunae]
MVVLLLLLACGLRAQLYNPQKISCHYILGELHLTISNNFLAGKHLSSQDKISTPYHEYALECYGSLTTISILQKDRYTQLKQHAGTFFFDSSLPAQVQQNLKELFVRIERNDTLLREGLLSKHALPFIDTSVYRNDNKPVAPSLQLVNDSLQVGDVLSVRLYDGTGKPVIAFRIRRKWAYTQPYLCAFRNDSTGNTMHFIHQELFRTEDWVKNHSYADWPAPGLELNNREFKAGSNLTCHFRPESGKGDSLYLFRLISPGQAAPQWTKTDGKIIIPALAHNTQYQLEVKYADRAGNVSVYSFYTPAHWYQTLWFVLSAGFIFFTAVVVTWLLYIAGRNKRRLRQQKLEMQVVYSQMNPHFVFNAMSSIQGLINDGKIEKANIYLTGFAGLLRAGILHARKEWIPVTSEMKSVESYIALEALRFNFKYSIWVAPDIADSIMLPPLLSQPLIENAVKHGLAGLGEAGMLGISVSVEGRDIVFLINDNGPGFHIAPGTKGQGIALTNDRIALFNSIYHPLSISLVFNKRAEIGTACIIRYKNWLEV